MHCSRNESLGWRHNTGKESADRRSQGLSRFLLMQEETTMSSIGVVAMPRISAIGMYS